MRQRKEVPEIFRFRSCCRVGRGAFAPCPPSLQFATSAVGTLRFAHPTRPLRRRHLIEEPGDAADAAVAEHGKIRALDRAVAAIGAETPAEADVVAEAVGLADQPEFEIRKALLHAGDERIDTVMAIAAHQRIDIAGVAGPVLAEDFAAAAWCPLVPQIDVAVGDLVDVGHRALRRLRRIDRLTDYRKSPRANRLPRRSRISILMDQ